MILIEVRDANKNDLRAVTNLWSDLADYHSKLSDHFILSWDGRIRWSRYINSKFREISTKLIVAEEGDKLVGFMLCLLSPNTPVYAERKIGVISDVYVAPERRKKGIAKLMFDHAVQWFRKNKVKTIQLGVAAVNPEALTVWRRLGFEPFVMYERMDISRVPERRNIPTRKLIRKPKKNSKPSNLRARIRIRRGP